MPNACPLSFVYSIVTIGAFRLVPAFALAATLATGCSSTPTASQDAEADQRLAIADSPAVGAEDRTAVIRVNGMGCPLCANNVDEQLRKVAGVEQVKINLGTGEVLARLSASAPPSREQLARAIENTGFTLVRIDMPTR